MNTNKIGSFYIGINSTAQKAENVWIGKNNIAKRVSKIYVGNENNKAKLCYVKPGQTLIGLGIGPFEINAKDGSSYLTYEQVQANNSIVFYKNYTFNNTNKSFEGSEPITITPPGYGDVSDTLGGDWYLVDKYVVYKLSRIEYLNGNGEVVTPPAPNWPSAWYSSVKFYFTEEKSAEFFIAGGSEQYFIAEKILNNNALMRLFKEYSQKEIVHINKIKTDEYYEYYEVQIGDPLTGNITNEYYYLRIERLEF